MKIFRVVVLGGVYRLSLNHSFSLVIILRLFIKFSRESETLS